MNLYCLRNLFCLGFCRINCEGNFVVLKQKTKNSLNKLLSSQCLDTDKFGRISTFNKDEKKYRVICDVNNSLIEHFYKEDSLKLKPILQ